MSTDELWIDSERVARELEHLSTFNDASPVEGSVAVTRVVYSATELRARAWIKELAAAEGLELRDDPVGNTFARWAGTEPALPAVGTGSHIDAIPQAGMYDGTVGVLGALEAMRALKRAGLRPRRSLELIVFASEEPTRFGIGCLGSRLLAGTLDAETSDALSDAEGRTLRELRESSGYRGALRDVRLRADYYSAWVELHIEQGPLLEQAGVPLGIVTAIAAPSSFRFTIHGVGGHAGALLMPDRRDALCAGSELVLAVEREALASGSIDTVATVGTCEIYPGAVNSVPSRVALQLDLRDTDPERRDSVLTRIRTAAEEIAKRRGVTVQEEMVNRDLPAHCSPAVVLALEDACGREGLSAKLMVSRAYHDTLFMARVAPAAMLFIPCRGGVSHRPDEFASREEIGRGTRVLARALAKLADS